MLIETAGRPASDRTRVPAALTVFNPPDAVDAIHQVDSKSYAEISARGNSSYYLAKQSFRLELQDQAGRDRKQALLGLPPDSDWVLHSSATDRTFARNLLAQELWHSTGRYSLRWRFMELFVITNTPISADASRVATGLSRVLRDLESTNRVDAQTDELYSALVSSYRGVYAVFEKIKRSKARVDIAKLAPGDDREPEVTGGYVIKKDDQGRNERGVITGQELQLRFEEPKERELSAAQRTWMTQFLDRFEKALYGKRFREPSDGYASFIDVESFIDFHWMVEISKNADGYWLSQYMHKDRVKKLTMGPLWDWDNTFGNPFFGMSRTNEWRFEGASDPDYAWYRRLFEDPDFLQRYTDRWSELRANQFSDTRVFAIIDRIADSVRGAVIRDENRWLRRGQLPLRVRAGITFDDEIGVLKRWISGRLAWIDSQSFPKPNVELTKSDAATAMTASWTQGRCFYTLDGSDPRARGGGVAHTAREYVEPVQIKQSPVVTVRVRSQFGLWSAPVVLR